MEDIRKTTLKGTFIEVVFSYNANRSRCKCGKRIWYANDTRTGRKIPIEEIEPGEYKQHLNDCPKVIARKMLIF